MLANIDIAELNHKRLPFTIIPNAVINHFRDGDAFLLWAYLVSKTDNWKIIKSNICNHFRWSLKKANKMFNILFAMGLASETQEKDDLGKFGKYVITIDHGERFAEACESKKPRLVDNFEKTNEINNSHRYPICGVAGSPPSGKRHTTKDINNTKDLNTRNKEKSDTRDNFYKNPEEHLGQSPSPAHAKCGEVVKSLSSKTAGEGSENHFGEREPASNDYRTDNNFLNKESFFETFWAIYPKKYDKEPARMAWQSKNLDEMADFIISDVKTRIAKHATWREMRFIPKAENYLLKCQWENDIYSELAPKKPQLYAAQTNHVTRDTMSDECRNVKRGSPEVANYHLQLMREKMPFLKNLGGVYAA